jgi:hypothetical protein
MEMDEALRVLASLAHERVEYVLFGGAALAFHGLIRATEDLDLFVRPTPENIERLRKALQAVYQDPSISEITAEELAGEYPAIRYCPPEGEMFLDIVARLGEFARFEDLESQVVRVEGVDVQVATPKTLYWMKKDTVRPQDRIDAQALRQKFHLEE